MVDAVDPEMVDAVIIEGMLFLHLLSDLLKHLNLVDLY